MLRLNKKLMNDYMKLEKKLKYLGLDRGKRQYPCLSRNMLEKQRKKAVNSFANDAVAQIIKENKLRQLKKTKR